MTTVHDRPLTLEERIERHRRMADSYRRAYAERTVQDGEAYEAWTFSEDATYWSPYFGSEVIPLSDHSISVQGSATMEAVAYSVKFDGWGPVDFSSWPSDSGFAMKTRFEGRRRSDGETMGFFAYGYVLTDELGRITRWETHVDRDYDAFLDEAIGVHGPFGGRADDYMEALARTLQRAGVELPQM